MNLADSKPEAATPKRVAVLVGKELHCLEQLLSDWKSGGLPGRLVGIYSNHSDAEALARSAGVPFETHGSDNLSEHLDWLFKTLSELNPNLIVLARYMRILPPKLVTLFRHRIINIHPSLQPTFAGPAPYKQAFDKGVRIQGCTAHFVTDSLDEGPVILQDVFHIDVGTDSPDDVKRKGLELEARTLSRAVQLFLNDDLLVIGGKVIHRPAAISQAGG